MIDAVPSLTRCIFFVLSHTIFKIGSANHRYLLRLFLKFEDNRCKNKETVVL
jgi:hypothetical protein